MRDRLNWNPFRESLGVMDVTAFSPTFEVKDTPSAYVFKADIQSSKVDAHLRDGVLTVTVRKSPEANPQKIQIQS
jgi:hypothetical protein